MSARRAGLAGLLWLPCLAAAGAAQGPDAAAVADRLASIGSIVAGGPMWLPDGRVLYLSSEGEGGVFAVPASGGAATRLAPSISAQLVRLAPDGRHLAFLSDRSGNPEIWLLDLSDGRSRQLSRLGARINAMSWAPDGAGIAFSALRDGQFDLWDVRVADGRVTRLTSDPAWETYPAWTPDGRSLVYVRSDDRWADHDVMVLPRAGGPPRVAARDRDLFDYGTLATRARFGYPIVSPDGTRALFPSHRNGWINYWVADLAGGPARVLAADTADQSDAAWSPDGREVVLVRNRNGTHDLQVITVASGAARSVSPIRIGVINAPAWSPDGRRIAFTYATPAAPADIYVVAAGGGPRARLTRSLDDETVAGLIEPEKVRYASDEYRIAAYLFRRPPAPGERQPGILYIHGGPTGQFSDTYLAQAQFLAAMGYAVLAPNIRGSSGYGKAFEDANNPCWTHCDLRDVVAGAEFLRGLPGVDADRIGITGISYGGIMSMGAVAHAPDVFSAAVPQSGYADWISFQSYNAELQHTKLLAYEWGPWPDSAAVYRRNSSIFSAGRVTAPVFVLHGEGRSTPWRPSVSDIPASREFVHALDRQYKVVRYKTYPGETYYVSGRENARQVMLDILGFFDQYLRDGIAPAPGSER